MSKIVIEYGNYKLGFVCDECGWRTGKTTDKIDCCYKCGNLNIRRAVGRYQEVVHYKWWGVNVLSKKFVLKEEEKTVVN